MRPNSPTASNRVNCDMAYEKNCRFFPISVIHLGGFFKKLIHRLAARFLVTKNTKRAVSQMEIKN